MSNIYNTYTINKKEKNKKLYIDSSKNLNTSNNNILNTNSEQFSFNFNGIKFNNILYYSLLSLVVAGIIFSLIVQINNIDLYALLPKRQCTLKSTVGIYCPGCGGTRSVIHLLSGHFLTSVLYHPVVPYFAIGVFSYVISYTIHLISKRNIDFLKIKPLFFYILIGIILGQWIIKNIILFITGIYFI